MSIIESIRGAPTAGPSPSHPPSPDWLKIPECAVIARVSEKTVRRWIADKRLRARRLPGPHGRYLVARADLDTFIEGVA
jgi:excisionase family DNA binding protein